LATTSQDQLTNITGSTLRSRTGSPTTTPCDQKDDLVLTGKIHGQKMTAKVLTETTSASLGARPGNPEHPRWARAGAQGHRS